MYRVVETWGSGSFEKACEMGASASATAEPKDGFLRSDIVDVDPNAVSKYTPPSSPSNVDVFPGETVTSSSSPKECNNSNNSPAPRTRGPVLHSDTMEVESLDGFRVSPVSTPRNPSAWISASRVSPPASPNLFRPSPRSPFVYASPPAQVRAHKPKDRALSTSFTKATVVEVFQLPLIRSIST